MSKNLFDVVESLDILRYALKPVDHRLGMLADSAGGHFDSAQTRKGGVGRTDAAWLWYLGRHCILPPGRWMDPRPSLVNIFGS
jgi:hypothetical protein